MRRGGDTGLKPHMTYLSCLVNMVLLHIVAGALLCTEESVFPLCQYYISHFAGFFDYTVVALTGYLSLPASF